MDNWSSIKTSAVLENDTNLKSLLKDIDEAFLLPREEKWRKIVSIFLKIRPDLQLHYLAVIKEVTEEKAKATNKFAESDEKSMRLGLKLPEFIWEILSTADPEFQDLMSGSGGTPAEQKKMYRQLVKAFPEFQVPQVM